MKQQKVSDKVKGSLSPVDSVGWFVSEQDGYCFVTQSGRYCYLVRTSGNDPCDRKISQKVANVLNINADLLDALKAAHKQLDREMTALPGTSEYVLMCKIQNVINQAEGR